MSRRSRSVPSLQTPSTPTEYKSSRVSACSTLMCPCDNCGAGEGMCAHSGDACCTQLLGNSGGIIRSPGEASSDAVYSSFGSLLPPHPDSQLCSPVLGMKSGDSFLYTVTLLELLPILSFLSVGFGPEGGPGCQGGQADRQPLCLDPAAALESWNKSLREASPHLSPGCWRDHPNASASRGMDKEHPRRQRKGEISFQQKKEQ